jgi:hypothetical protein
VNRQLGYLAAAAIVIAIAAWLFASDRDHGELPAGQSSIAGVYRITDVRMGRPDALADRASLVGRPFILRRDGPDLVAGLCPDDATCRRWLDETPAFRHALASLPVDIAFADADPEAVLSAAHVVGSASATTTTTEDGRCRRRIESGSLTATEIGLRLRRELAQTELVVDCEAQPTDDRLLVELTLVRMHLD